MTELEFSSNEQGFITADYDNLSLSSAFQPIFSIAHRRPVGYEALLRARDSEGNTLSPLEVMKRPGNSREHLELDRICRLLHAHNFARAGVPEDWLFINLNSQCLVTERPDAGFMHDLMTQTGIPARKIVIEILESEIDDRDYLKQLIQHFRQLGCLIAIDDFGAGHSNFDRIWELSPDIVKIDRNLIKEAGRSVKVERILAGIVSLLHEAGSLVVEEGVETEEEARVAISSNTDMVQGFYFARPDREIKQDQEFAVKLEGLLHRQRHIRSQHNVKLQSRLDAFKQRFDAEILALRQRIPFEQCGKAVFSDERAISCYLLDEQGFQIGKTLYAPQYTRKMDIRFSPLLAGENANWSHRHYHYSTIQNPGVTQVSRPYLSVAGARMCITIAQALEVDSKRYVFCCDLDWPDEDVFPL
jgi:EAL domain-containing protein (putative c-di-GMP-specific phosphodiesterase class I)